MFSHSSGVTYEQYLRTRQLERDNCWGDVSKTTLLQIATLDELKSIGVTVRDSSVALGEGMASIHTELAEMRQATEAFRADFNWAMSAVVDALSGLSDQVSMLIRVSQNPERTWALEQYSLAREALAKGFGRNALQHLDQAINGDGRGHNGYPYDHRFHFLTAQLNSGFQRQTSGLPLDLRKAVDSFEVSWQCAEDDNQKTISLLGAAYAAYVMNDLDRSLQLLARAEETPEVLFCRAKYCYAIDDRLAGYPALEKAIRVDARYSLRAEADADFHNHRKDLSEIQSRIQTELRERIAQGRHIIELYRETYSVLSPAAKQRTHLLLAEVKAVDTPNFTLNTGPWCLHPVEYHCGPDGEKTADTTFLGTVKAAQTFEELLTRITSKSIDRCLYDCKLAIEQAEWMLENGYESIPFSFFSRERRATKTAIRAHKKFQSLAEPHLRRLGSASQTFRGPTLSGIPGPEMVKYLELAVLQS